MKKHGLIERAAKIAGLQAESITRGCNWGRKFTKDGIVIECYYDNKREAYHMYSNKELFTPNNCEWRVITWGSVSRFLLCKKDSLCSSYIEVEAVAIFLIWSDHLTI